MPKATFHISLSQKSAAHASHTPAVSPAYMANQKAADRAANKAIHVKARHR